MRPHISRIIVIFAVLLLPCVAHADMMGGWIETPLDNLEILHLFILNAVIGSGEALVVWVLLRVRPGIGVIIGANYLSALIGFLLAGSMLAVVGKLVPGESLVQREVPTLVIVVLVAFVLTVLIEWPFFVLSLRGRGITARRLFLACAAAQVASYTCLAVAYYYVSDIGALTLLKPVSVGQIATSPHADVYYIDQRDGNLWRVATDGSARVRVVKAGLPADDRLIIKRSENGLCRVESDDHVLAEEVPGICTTDTDATNDVVDLSGTSAVKTSYQIDCGGIDNGDMGYTIHFDGKPVALETPLDRINIDSPSVLPNHRAVFEMTNDSGVHEIELLDLDDGRIAKLTDGRSPVVVLDRPAFAKPVAVSARAAI